jgi:hypothetical protein
MVLAIMLCVVELIIQGKKNFFLLKLTMYLHLLFSFFCRFLFSWPNSKCSVMGPDQLTGVMDIIMRESAAR